MSNELLIAIISFAIGYFWAMWRKDNIKVTVTPEFRVTKGFIDACILAREAAEMEGKLAVIRETIRKEIDDNVQTTVKAD